MGVVLPAVRGHDVRGSVGRAGFFTGFCNSLEMFCLVAESASARGDLEVLVVHLPRDIDPGSGISLLTKGNGFQTPKTG